MRASAGLDVGNRATERHDAGRIVGDHFCCQAQLDVNGPVLSGRPCPNTGCRPDGGLPCLGARLGLIVRRGQDMSEKIRSEMISRRKAISLLAAAVGFAVPTTALTVSNAEAQTVGMQRRHERRVGRHERREDRRTGRHERRQDRRTGVATPQ